MTDSPWLTDEQQQAWRQWVEANMRLTAAIARQLHLDSGLSLPDFEVLVMLTDTPDARVRVSDLAARLQWERSRLSHHLKRMEGRGLIRREGCESDGRGAFVVLTSGGRAAIEEAAPGHAGLVRRLVFSRLTAEELSAFTAVTRKVLDEVRECPQDTPEPQSTTR